MRRSILPLFLAFFLLSGCGGISPKPAKPKVDRSLPTVTKIRTLSDVTAIALEWTPIYDEKIEGYYLYRGERNGPLKRIAKIGDRYSSHYLDRGLQPGHLYRYRITSFKGGSESPPSQPVEVKTLPIPDSVPFISAIDHLPREVKLIWRPHPYLKIDRYILERREPKDREWQKIAEIKGRLNVEYIDRGLKDNRVYYYRLFAKSCDGLLSRPSKVIEASTKPRPSTVRGLTASRNLPRKIVVQWKRNPEEDIAYYKVYKSLFEIGPYVVEAKVQGTSYTDKIKEDGVRRYYKVTAVDRDGLESFKQYVPVVGETLPKPLHPLIIRHDFDGKRVELVWEPQDNRAVSYIVKKREIVGLFKYNDYIFKNIHSTRFVDTKLRPDAKYIYRVYAVDRYGLQSDPSNEITFSTKR
ncbi:MAG: fibronectin type III domain-containing protein [Epsilonproteobacteria bacterium]|nr:hypothetical protein [Campylobacterota bacterium]NPA57291.1 fibronectin type III domain-containing protein [Campylobacterota bacterium]